MKFLPLLLSLCLCATNIHAQDDDAYKRLEQQATTYYRQGDFKRSAETLESAIALKGDKCGYSEVYNAACSWARAGNADNAFKHLNYLAGSIMTDPERRLGKRHMDPLFYLFDKDLQPLQADKRWDEFMARLQKRRTPLVNMLDSIYLDDQHCRQQLPEIEKTYGNDSKEMTEVWARIQISDSINLLKVRKIIDSLGWLGPDSIGERGSRTLFLVIQHSDQQTQEHYLPIMREAAQKGDADKSSLALLEDRVALAQGKRQIYGSQVGRGKDGKYYVLPLENPDSVDIRRRSMALGRMSYYLKNWDMTWDVEAYKKQLPELDKLHGIKEE
jgi:hypothetical protein